MYKSAFEEIAHAGMISWMIGEAPIRQAFQNDTGFNINTLAGRSTLDEAIDKATGYEEELIYRFVVWATEKYWNKPEDAKNIEVYRRAKAYLKNKKENTL